PKKTKPTTGEDTGTSSGVNSAIPVAKTPTTHAASVRRSLEVMEREIHRPDDEIVSNKRKDLEQPIEDPQPKKTKPTTGEDNETEDNEFEFDDTDDVVPDEEGDDEGVEDPVDESHPLSGLLNNIKEKVKGEKVVGYVFPSAYDTGTAVKLFSPHHTFCQTTERWWYFEGHTWHQGGKEKFNPYRNVITEDFVSYIKKEQVVGRLPANSGKIDALIKHLKNNTTAIAKACKDQSTFKSGDGSFAKRLHHAHLMGFQNGILNLTPAEMPDNQRFRDGTPADHVLLQCPYNYQSLKALEDKNDLNLLTLLRVLKEILTEEYDFTMRVLSTALIRSVSKQKVLFLQGTGGDGKSLLVKLMRWAFGSRGGSAPALVLSRDINPEKDSTYADVADCDVYGFLESAKKRTINAETFKLYSGDDEMRMRATHEKRKLASIKALIIVCTNTRPRLEDTTDGTKRRLIVQKMRAKFGNEEDRDNHRYLKDMSLHSEAMLDKLCVPLMALLVDFHLKNGGNPDVPLSLAPAVEEETKRYIEEFCPFSQFLNNHTIFDKEAVIKQEDFLIAWRCFIDASQWKGLEHVRMQDMKDFVRNNLQGKVRLTETRERIDGAEKSKNVQGLRLNDCCMEVVEVKKLEKKPMTKSMKPSHY
ncbi:hypothetical protein HK104_003009, partial [Borealophlyctis nickersoniae]